MTHHARPIDPKLQKLEELLIRATVETGPIWEGRVMTPSAPPYRRLDCDGRALAYVRTRPTKHAVRVDVSGLWRTPEAPPGLRIDSSGSSATLLIREERDVHDVALFLRKTVETTRALPRPAVRPRFRGRRC